MTITAAAPLREMDGRNLYYAFIAGSKKLIEHQVELNRINVFPVKDGDTGTNLAGTVRSVIESLHPHRSYKITADRIAESTLMNARGNSGIIFAQFFYGLSHETGDFKSVTLKQFAEAFKKSVSYVYEAVAKPVEGTMLTVIREMAEFIYSSWNKFTDFNHLMMSSYEVLLKSLQKTRTKLAVLEKNNVVDAGAKGFVVFIEGIIEFINKRNIKDIIMAGTAATADLQKIEETFPEVIDFRYCTEAIIRECRYDKQLLSDTLNKFGNSSVIAGSDKLRRIHVHTNEPAELFKDLRKAGTITFQKADDMIRHYETANDRKWNIALVTDSTCDLSQEFLDHYQINMTPINISFGENHYLDKVTIRPEQFYSLLDESEEYPKSSQVNENTFVNLYSHLASHYDSVIAIHLSEKLSGTFFSSKKAADRISREFGKQISVINSRNLSGALGLIVLRTAKAIESGKSHDEIVALTEKWIRNARILVSVKTLKYLVRGGRVSHIKGWIANLLNINPIVSVDETGKSIVFDKAFSQKANMQKVMDHIKKTGEGKTIWNYIVLHANNEDAAKWYSEEMEKLTSIKPVSVVNISPVVGLNAGVGAASVALMYE
ncbi:MAG TPA: DegV family protein [Bacteroidales bacterium]|nr:DegV family protein [Bacteroidales bacterium]HOX73816.1 DegV family protein [Bacteroidales bacterium]HPM86677.1 DegV family protein [Bacteroidales bacterium]HQM68378.1 DegV family protein [Bacteroidales bacterium]